MFSLQQSTRLFRALICKYSRRADSRLSADRNRIAQAKTGTGKTVGFLLPMLQNIISKDPTLGDQDTTFRRRRLFPDIRAIIISPTRELAEQIAVEARRLTAHTSLKVQTAVGGTGKREGMKRIMYDGCHVLVATPGRLNDILSDQYSRLEVPNLDYLIFDEADRLLESGFWDEIQSINQNLPDRKVRDRQTLMFSATVPREVVGLVRKTLKPGFHFVKTVRDDEEPTHQRIPQKLVMATGFETQVPALLELCQREAELSISGQKRPFKAIVFFNSLKEVSVAFSAFREIRRNQRRQGALWKGDLFCIHSNLTQGARQRTADSFRAAERAIMFSTNVTARGMDFPNVTHVIQLGLPRDPADYVHRIGRTGRAGKEGEGWLILPEFDAFGLRTKLSHIPLKEDNSLVTAKADLNALEKTPEHAVRIIKDVQDGFREVSPEDLADAYPSILSANGGIRDKRALLGSMQTMATQLWGLETIPRLPSSVTRGIGLKQDSWNGSSRGPRSSDSRGPRSIDRRDSRNSPPWKQSGGFSSGRPVNKWEGRGNSISRNSHDRSFDKPRGDFNRPQFNQRGRRNSFSRNMVD